MDQADLPIDPVIADYEAKLQLLKRACEIAFRRDALAEDVPRSDVATITLAALQAVVPAKELDGWLSVHQPRQTERVEHQALTLIAYFLSLSPLERLELIEYHLKDNGVNDPKQREALVKQLNKLAPIHATIAHLIMLTGVPSLRVDHEQQTLFDSVRRREPGT